MHRLRWDRCGGWLRLLGGSRGCCARNRVRPDLVAAVDQCQRFRTCSGLPSQTARWIGSAFDCSIDGVGDSGFGHQSDEFLDGFAVFEDDHTGDTGDAVCGGCFRVVIDV